MRPIDFRLAREVLSPLAALRLVGWRERYSYRGQYRGACVIHGSRPGSRTLSVNSQVAFCHKCHWWGDAIDLWARLTHQGKLAAAYDLAGRLGVTLPEAPGR